MEFWYKARRLVRLTWLSVHLVIGIIAAYIFLPLLSVTGVGHGWHEIIIRAWMRLLLRIMSVQLHIHGHSHLGTVLYCANHVS